MVILLEATAVVVGGGLVALVDFVVVLIKVVVVLISVLAVTPIVVTGHIILSCGQ